MGGLLGSLHTRTRTASVIALLSVIAMAGCASSGGSPPDAGEGSEDPPPASTASAGEGEDVSPEQAYCRDVAMSMLQESGPAVASVEESAAALGGVGITAPADPLCGVTYDDSVSGRTVMLIWVGDDTVAPQLIEALSVDRFSAAEEAGPGYAISTFTDGGVVAAVAPVGAGNAMSTWSARWPDQFVTLLSVTLP